MREWKTISNAEGAYLESLDADRQSAFTEALEVEMMDGGGETRYDFLRDCARGVYGRRRDIMLNTR